MAKITGANKYSYWNNLRAKSLQNNPLKRTPIKKKVYKIKKVAKGRARELRIYSVLRKDYLKDHQVCECGRKDEKGNVCQRPSIEIHHSKGKIGSLLNDTRFWKAIARACHDWAEANPKEAKKIGLSVNRID